MPRCDMQFGGDGGRGWEPHCSKLLDAAQPTALASGPNRVNGGESWKGPESFFGPTKGVPQDGFVFVTPSRVFQGPAFLENFQDFKGT